MVPGFSMTYGNLRQILRSKHIGVTSLTFHGKRYVIGHVTV